MSDLGNKAIMAENIQRLMDSRGIDRNKICADLGFKYTTFTDWVKGNTYPRIDKIEMMAYHKMLLPYVFPMFNHSLMTRPGSSHTSNRLRLSWFG